MAAPGELRLRLIRADDRPATNPEGDDYVFGLQDTKQAIVAGAPRADGALVFDFSVRVKPGKNDGPDFAGPFVSGKVGDRFVYLSWLSIPRRVWINRVKVRLIDIDWATIEAAQAAGRPLVADATGWSPGGSRRFVAWRLADD